MPVLSGRPGPCGGGLSFRKPLPPMGSCQLCLASPPSCSQNLGIYPRPRCSWLVGPGPTAPHLTSPLLLPLPGPPAGASRLAHLPLLHCLLPSSPSEPAKPRPAARSLCPGPSGAFPSHPRERPSTSPPGCSPSGLPAHLCLVPQASAQRPSATADIKQPPIPPSSFTPQDRLRPTETCVYARVCVHMCACVFICLLLSCGCSVRTSELDGRMCGRMDLKGSLVGKTGCSFHQILFPQGAVRAFR